MLGRPVAHCLSGNAKTRTVSETGKNRNGACFGQVVFCDTITQKAPRPQQHAAFLHCRIKSARLSIWIKRRNRGCFSHKTNIITSVVKCQDISQNFFKKIIFDFLIFLLLHVVYCKNFCSKRRNSIFPEFLKIASVLTHLNVLIFLKR